MDWYKLAQSFDYDEVDSDMWKRVRDAGFDLFGVSVDFENDDRTGDTFSVAVKDNRFVCQPWACNGDWEDPVPYFRCQFQHRSSEYSFESFGTEINTEDNSFFVFVPDAETAPSECRKELEKFLDECLKKR